MSIFLLFQLDHFYIESCIIAKNELQEFVSILAIELLPTKKKLKVLFYIFVSPKYQFKKVSLYYSFKSSYVYILRNIITKMGSELCLHIYFIKDIAHALLWLNIERVYCLCCWFANMFFGSKNVSDIIWFDSNVFFD